jgi:ketosteroid isomerase-like protein
MQKSVITFSIGLVLLCCFALAPANAQQWNAAQQEVWAAIENAWDMFAKNDLQGALSVYHPDYVGWHYEAQVPSDFETGKKWITYFLPKEEIVLYDIKPASIIVHGNFAVVHYFFTVVSKTEKEEESFSSGRWTETWVKEGNKWLIIGDHGGTTSDKK